MIKSLLPPRGRREETVEPNHHHGSSAVLGEAAHREVHQNKKQNFLHRQHMNSIQYFAAQDSNAKLRSGSSRSKPIAAWPPAKTICGVNALDDLHDELSRSWERRVRTTGLNVRFAEKPLPEWPEIELLGTTQEILAEGEELNQCVVSYIPEMTSGEKPILLYRVLWPERATLRLMKGGESWRIAELRCHRNRSALPEAFDFVNEWLRAVQDMTEGELPTAVGIDPDLCPF